MKPKKSLGQNFLISPRISNAIANAGEIKKGETVVEIGRGKARLQKNYSLLAQKSSPLRKMKIWQRN